MKLRIGYELNYRFGNPTPAILMLNVHSSRVGDLIVSDHVTTLPAVPLAGYLDGHGNWCTRLVAPAGTFTLRCDAVIRDHGLPDSPNPKDWQVPVEDLPNDALVFLLASRFCDSDRLLDMAWQLFGNTLPGRTRVQAVCDFVHNHIVFGYAHASVGRNATQAYEDRRGVCRDYAHLAIAFCRALNIPARYCTGYLSDIGTPEPHPPGDFAAWMEVYLGGEWQMFDPRNNKPMIGRILMARGRDAADVAITTTFGPNTLTGFRVWTDPIEDGA
jgi:transglutaminase-like putative cysteine protease